MIIKSPAEQKVHGVRAAITRLTQTFAALRGTGCEITGKGIALFEAQLLAIQFDLDEVEQLIVGRQQELIEVVDVATRAIAEAEAESQHRDAASRQALTALRDAIAVALAHFNRDQPAPEQNFQPSNILVFTGQYRPQPANDGGAVS